MTANEIGLLATFLQHASASGSKSTALKPLGGLIGILLVGTIASTWRSGPSWLSYCLISLTVLTVLLFFAAYVYFMIKSPEYLRSEKYSLERLKIEKEMVGDSGLGMIDINERVGCKGSLQAKQEGGAL